MEGKQANARVMRVAALIKHPEAAESGDGQLSASCLGRLHGNPIASAGGSSEEGANCRAV
jgi:hypothetical protein